MLSCKRLGTAACAIALALMFWLFSSPTAYASGSSDTLTFAPEPPVSVSVGDSITIFAEMDWSANGSENPTGQSISIGGPDNTSCTATLVAAGAGVDTASCALTVEAAGSGSWSLTYAGDGHLPASGASTSVTVTAAKTTTSLTSSANPANAGQTVTYTARVATVADSYSASAAPASGGISFDAGGQPIGGCSDVPVDSQGQASCDQVDVGASANTTPITATYADLNSGGANLGNYATSTSNTVNQAVDQIATTTALTLTPSSSVVAGSAVTVVAQISPTPDGGTVNFSGSPSLSEYCSNVPVQNGQARCETAIDTAGSYQAVATYSGDAVYGASSSSGVGIAVSQDATSTAIVGTPSPNTNPFTLMDALTLTATVKAASPTGPSLASGTVTFNNSLYRPSEPVPGCVNLAVPDSGVVTCTVPSLFSQGGGFAPLIAGIDAQYSATFTSASTVFGASTSPVWSRDETLVPTTTTIVGESPSQPAVNRSVAISAKVSPIPSATWKGSGHTFTVTANAVTISLGKKSCDATINDSTGIATCDLEESTSGDYDVKADYIGTRGSNSVAGAGTWARSNSKSVPLFVGKTSLVTVSASKNPAGVKQFVTYTAVVDPGFFGGTVAFDVMFTKHGKQTVNVLSGCGAKAVNHVTDKATCTVSLNSAGDYPIYAVFSGAGLYGSSQSREIHEKVS